MCAMHKLPKMISFSVHKHNCTWTHKRFNPFQSDGSTYFLISFRSILASASPDRLHLSLWAFKLSLVYICTYLHMVSHIGKKEEEKQQVQGTIQYLWIGVDWELHDADQPNPTKI